MSALGGFIFFLGCHVWGESTLVLLRLHLLFKKFAFTQYVCRLPYRVFVSRENNHDLQNLPLNNTTVQQLTCAKKSSINFACCVFLRVLQPPTLFVHFTRCSNSSFSMSSPYVRTARKLYRTCRYAARFRPVDRLDPAHNPQRVRLQPPSDHTRPHMTVSVQSGQSKALEPAS